MGNHPSAHQPLERATSYSGNALRLSKRERSPGKRMDRLRRSFRDSFRRRKDSHVPESSKPHQWQSDESAVRSATCAFHVKYLGCVEVFESRGMQVCEEALKVLRNSRRRPVRAILHVSGDGLRVVEDETKGLIVDQTIEKVSFCAPDRNHEKGFSYICRDGTTRRWMCHGFLALKESGERLSHAVGCAFAACLERKQRRDKECGVTMTFDSKTSTFTRSGSFRQPSLTERLQDARERSVDAPPVKQVFNPFAIERPHATPSMLERQGSFRGFNQLNQASPFKRQLSLRVSDLPSNLERTRSHSLEPTDLGRLPQTHPHIMPLKPPVSPIPEISPSGQDSVSAMCQQLSQGLSLLSSSDDYGPLPSRSTVNKQLFAARSSPPVSTSNSLDDMRLRNGTMINNNHNNSKANNNNNNNDVDEDDENNDDDLRDDESTMRTNANNSVELSWQDSSARIAIASTNQRLTPILNNSGANKSPVTGHTCDTTTGPSTLGMNVSAIRSNRSIVPYRSNLPISSPSYGSASGVTSIGTSVIVSANKPPIPINTVTPVTSSSSLPSVTVASSTMGTATSVAVEVKPLVIAQPVIQKAETELEMIPTSRDLPRPEQWLGSVTGSVPTSVIRAVAPVPQQQAAPRRAPPLHARAHSLGSAAMGNTLRGGPSDPFDAEWAEIAARNLRQAGGIATATATTTTTTTTTTTSTTNPFIVPNSTQAFQVQL